MADSKDRDMLIAETHANTEWLRDNFNQFKDEMRDETKILHKRINKLEKKLNWFSGFAACFLFLFEMLKDKLTLLFK